MELQCEGRKPGGKKGFCFLALALCFCVLLTGYGNSFATVCAAEDGEESMSGNSVSDNSIELNGDVSENSEAEPELMPQSQEEVMPQSQEETMRQSQGEAMWQIQEGGEWRQGTLTEAIAGVYAGGIVVLLSDIPLTDGLTVSKPMLITSYDSDKPCTIKNTSQDMDDKASRGRIFTVNGGPVTLENVILDGGRDEGIIGYHPLICVTDVGMMLGDGVVLQNAENVSQSLCGGGINIRKGQVLMYDGSKIVGCKAKHGGGIEVNSAGAYNTAMFGMVGGSIESCEADDGGGVYINIGIFQMQDGTITGNHSTREDTGSMRTGGGGIYVAGERKVAAALIGNGKVTNNTAVSSGGGILIQGQNALLQMQGGLLEGNSAKTGGGISAIWGNLKLYGGTVTGNTAYLYGGGILGSPDSLIELQGNPKVFGNTSGDTFDQFDNLYLDGAEDDSAAWATSPLRLTGPLTEGVQLGLSRWVRPDEGEHPYREVIVPYRGYVIQQEDFDRLNVEGQLYADNMEKYAFIQHEGNVVMILAAHVILDRDRISLAKADETAALIATVLPDNALIKDVSWSSSDSDVAVVDTKGVVTAVGEGEAVITATTVLPYYATASCKVTVGKALEGGEEEPDGPNPPKEPDGTEDTENDSDTDKKESKKGGEGETAPADEKSSQSETMPADEKSSQSKTGLTKEKSSFMLAGENSAGQTEQDFQSAQNPRTGSGIVWAYVALGVSAFCMLVSAAVAFSYHKNARANKKENEEIIREVVLEPSEAYSGKKEKPDADWAEGIQIDFERLKEWNTDTAGWLVFHNRCVNYPLVQTDDNSYYLNHSFMGEENKAGSIFVDCRNNSFEDRNVVIYGHNMSDHTMFGSLKDVFHKKFWEEENNDLIYLFDTDHHLRKYKIFSYYIVENEDYYITTLFRSDAEYAQFLEAIQARSLGKTDVVVTPDDHILTLSTCAGASGTRRRVIHAVLCF